ncbi:hydroxymethylglutaryl-CoA reductase [Salinibacillus kushneri]|uniref:3-hydroxy-3-methylglutaryl coenzyme A reductase n=1 Tax=Salinibacillus kushneri TaxID=237682 RepID=A0A1I0A9V2_9BACI|nr:hydroxymethylglutaryl-CoA reductase, degradative [Salinibacillus kushneri]SES90928.1 hydroxymethylglutaryl-CoA reductase [Salinibacillus kushneri]
MENKYLHKFYQKNRSERIGALVLAGVIHEDDAALLRDGLSIPEDVADNMIENQIGKYELPLGAALNFLINGKEYAVPMAIEEPSVVAAASSAAKIINKAGGFHTSIEERRMIGQVALKDIPNLEDAENIIMEHKANILQIANESKSSIVKRGGGAKDLLVRVLPADEQNNIPSFLVVHLHIETLEAMGANIIDTMVEAIKPYLEEITNGKALMGILSNYATDCLATAECRIPLSLLEKGEFSGEEVRDRIIEATQFAYADPYRAVTHNKGIMNGVDAVVIASGNDWRAIEAGAHAYAARSGQYRSLSTWEKGENGELIGRLTLPLPVGAVGGQISIHPAAQFTKRLMGYENAKGLESIIVSAGLGQNLSAIKALVTEGIQKGHMKLHAKSLAISAGATGTEIEVVSEKLRQSKKMDLNTAKEMLKDLREQ